MIAGSRNPMWGEEFDFYIEELPVEVCHSFWFVCKHAVQQSRDLELSIGSHQKFHSIQISHLPWNSIISHLTKKLQQDKKQYIESMWFLIDACTSESFILQLKLFVVAKGFWEWHRAGWAGTKCLICLCSYVVVLVFHFVTPLQIQIAIYDWDIVWKSQLLGSMSLIINAEEQNGASWHLLDSTGKVRSSFQKSIPIGIFHYFLFVWPCYLIAVFLPFLILQCCSLFLCVEFCNGPLSF